MLAPYAPFHLIFADCGVRDEAAFAALCGMLQPGGRIVMDDLTPVHPLPAESAPRGRPAGRCDEPPPDRGP